MTEHGMMRWFGPRAWGSVCQTATEIPTPVGSSCFYCEESFTDGDEGVSVPYISLEAITRMRWIFYHQKCLFRSIVGSVGHQTGACSEGQEDTSEIGMTKREAAIAASDYWLEHNTDNPVRDETPRTIH